MKAAALLPRWVRGPFALAAEIHIVATEGFLALGTQKELFTTLVWMPHAGTANINVRVTRPEARDVSKFV